LRFVNHVPLPGERAGALSTSVAPCTVCINSVSSLYDEREWVMRYPNFALQEFCSFTPHPPPQNTLFNLFNTFTYKVERQYPLMCLLWLCRPMPMAPTWHHPGGQRGHRSARPHATQRAPHTSTSRAHVHTTTRSTMRSTYRQSPSPAISFTPAISFHTSISMVPSLALAPADLGPHRGDVVMRTTNMLTRTDSDRRLLPCTL
jgi:hypothetical protein